MKHLDSIRAELALEKYRQMDKVRDELAHARAIQIDKKYKPNELTVYANARQSYVKGFMAAVRELEPVIKELVEALEKIDIECSNHDTTAWSIANNALEKYKEMMGEK